MNIKKELTDKLVLLAGCTSGIGLSTFHQLVMNNCKIAIVGRNQNELEKLKKKYLKVNKKIEYFVCDFSKSFSSDELIYNITNKFNQDIDIFIYSAAIATLGGAEDIPYDVYKNSMNVNFFSPLKITKTIIKSMKLKNKGQIVFFNSGSEKRGLPYSSAYSVGKAALSVYIESLRVELHKTDIDIISIYPGKIKTNLMFKNKKYGNFKIYDTKNSKGPEYVAKEVIKALYAKKYYIYLSLIPRIGVMLSLIFPRMFDKYLSSKIRSK